MRRAYSPKPVIALEEAIKSVNCCNKKTPCSFCGNLKECRAWKKYVDDKGTFKKYAHFDERTSLSSQATLRKVMDPSFVSKYAFWPFIHYQVSRAKYSKSKKKLVTKNPRDIRYCAHLDRCIYQRYSFLLDRLYNIFAQQQGIDDVAIAYRTNSKKCNIDFAKEVFCSIEEMGNCYVLVGDFESFFDKLDHIHLKNMMCKLLGEKFLPPDYYAVFKSLTRYSSWDWKDLLVLNGLKQTKGARKKLNSQKIVLKRDDFKRCVKTHTEQNLRGVGIPQGSPMSAVLSNVYMIDFDFKINELAQSANGFYRRYCDDFVLVIPIRKDESELVYENSIKPMLDFISQFDGVVLQKDKTSLMLFGTDGTDNKSFSECRLDTGETTGNICTLDYLGFLYDHNGIRIRPKSITKYHYRLQKKCQGYIRCKRANHNVSPNNIYEIYAHHPNGRTFPNYIERAYREMDLNDPEAYSVLKNNRGKIKKAIRRAAH